MSSQISLIYISSPEVQVYAEWFLLSSQNVTGSPDADDPWAMSCPCSSSSLFAQRCMQDSKQGCSIPRNCEKICCHAMFFTFQSCRIVYSVCANTITCFYSILLYSINLMIYIYIILNHAYLLYHIWIHICDRVCNDPAVRAYMLFLHARKSFVRACRIHAHMHRNAMHSCTAMECVVLWWEEGSLCNLVECHWNMLYRNVMKGREQFFNF